MDGAIKFCPLENDGSVGQIDFIKLLVMQVKEPNQQAIKQIFTQIDPNGNGNVSIDDIQETFGWDPILSEITSLLNQKPDCDTISYVEFNTAIARMLQQNIGISQINVPY